MIENLCKNVLNAVLFTSFFLPTYSFADVYTGINLSYTSSEIKNNSDWQEESPVLAQIQGGYFFSDYIGAEIRYGKSIEGDASQSVEDITSAFIKGNLPITDQIAVYALAGYSDITAKNNSHNNVSDSDISLGVGLHYAFDSHKAATIELVRYADGNQVRLNGLQIGFQYRF
ncbi:outer membrane beta-barrel protein [Vibrio salinus]|uniref:outer membrane beta-barrel protein n=1 Tax=Vibrio salinus TaxID=2899784 RepID=UPI001E5834CC|nr:outer membrane beta-barrel protein [Vibrio salinus]MCE0493810.1 porin family protein [Vibrio salinus]